jgi:hypothetical protein
MKSFARFTEERLYHTSNDVFPNNKPNFDAYFGTAAFLKAFPDEFGTHTYSIELPDTANILILNVDSRTSRRFAADCALKNWPTDHTFAHTLLRDGITSTTRDDFYEVWTDKRTIIAVLMSAPYHDFDGVRFEDEYILLKRLIDRLPGTRIK